MMKFVLSARGNALIRLALPLACVLFLLGCSSSGASKAGAGASGAGATVAGAGEKGGIARMFGESPDSLRVGEMLVIEFSGVTDPPPRHEERVKVDGRITLPSIGTVQAAGKTRGELEAEIHKLYVPSYYQRLTVIVRNEGRFFYVKGQVKNPNQFPYYKEMTLLKAIAVAGDFTDFAKKTRVQITRADGRKVTVNCIKAIDDHRLDLAIYPDDTIEVPRRYF